MRLDKYLKVSRLIKRRTVANEACDNGRISVNGRVVKASYDVKVGDSVSRIVVEGIDRGMNPSRLRRGGGNRRSSWRDPLGAGPSVPSQAAP